MWDIYISQITHTQTYPMEYYSATKKNEILGASATEIDLENTVMLNEMSQDRRRQTQYNTSYMWNLKKIQMNIQNRNRLRHRKQTCGYQRGEGRKDRSGYGISRYELLYVK